MLLHTTIRPEPNLGSCRLSYASGKLRQCITTVKVYGVFPSSHKESRIFTGNSNSLSQHWRQRGSRYAIHAGRNLPAKEFRYLRTVRVTAAVYQGLDSKLLTLPLGVLAPGRPRTLYRVLRLCRVLCFY
jgi:hypothetical protein